MQGFLPSWSRSGVVDRRHLRWVRRCTVLPVRRLIAAGWRPRHFVMGWPSVPARCALAVSSNSVAWRRPEPLSARPDSILDSSRAGVALHHRGPGLGAALALDLGHHDLVKNAATWGRWPRPAPGCASAARRLLDGRASPCRRCRHRPGRTRACRAPSVVHLASGEERSAGHRRCHWARLGCALAGLAPRRKLIPSAGSGPSTSTEAAWPVGRRCCSTAPARPGAARRRRSATGGQQAASAATASARSASSAARVAS